MARTFLHTIVIRADMQRECIVMYIIGLNILEDPLSIIACSIQHAAKISFFVFFGEDWPKFRDGMC